MITSPDLPGNAFTRFFFFGNYFYGCCTLALAIEASLQQNTPIQSPLFYILLFCVTVIYYTTAYIASDTSAHTDNPRATWYTRHRRAMIISQYIFTTIFILGFAYFLRNQYGAVLRMDWLEWLLVMIFPLCALLYYGTSLGRSGSISLRRVGWLKPFVIGFIWAGLVNIYPAIFHALVTDTHFEPKWVTLFLFIKNFMFVTVLCILFDIKDYSMDYNAQLKTFVVRYGLKVTVFVIVIPLCFLGLASFLVYAFERDFSAGKIAINTIPFIAAIVVASQLQQRKGIFYYLVVIDGLMILKAACGSIGMLFF